MNPTPDANTIVPVNIGKIKAPTRSGCGSSDDASCYFSCFISMTNSSQVLPPLPELPWVSSNFTFIGQDIYSTDIDGNILKNGQVFVAGNGLLQASGNTLYVLSGSSMFTCDTTSDRPTLVPAPGWDTAPFLPNVNQFAWGFKRGWILSNGSTNQITEWKGPGHAPSVISWTAGPEISTISAIAVLGDSFNDIDTLCVADATTVWIGTVKDGVGEFKSILTLPASWGGLAGMLGQVSYYNDMESGIQQTGKYIYAIPAADANDGGPGYGFLLYPNTVNSTNDQAIFTAVSDLTPYNGPLVYGTMALDSLGCLYFLTAEGVGGMNRINPISGNQIYIDANAPSHITVLPNNQFALSNDPANPTLIQAWDGNTSISSIQAYFTDTPSNGYDKSFFQIVESESSQIVPQNPHDLNDGPALLLKLNEDQDGIVIIGDIAIDPLFWKRLHSSHPA